ncbi:MAG: 3-isopropylmalate dehydratase small subunit [bacterium]|nr:3-isopropylmalate dehydratase small subunit [bacterium]
MKFIGTVHKYGDNVNTDVIIPARRCNTIVPEELASYCLEDLDAQFVEKVQTGDILVGGFNFGCGSSRETAPVAIKYAGISCVAAKSFARIFYRNSINIGLPIVENPDFIDDVADGHKVEIDFSIGQITNHSTGKQFTFAKDTGVISDIVQKGGLVNYVKEELKS